MGHEQPKLPNNQTTKPEKKTLRDFVNENDRLIEVMGVFVALAVFVNDIRPFGHLLSFMFAVGVVLLWSELLNQFPSGLATKHLMMFENIVSLALFAFGISVIVQYPQYIVYLYLPAAVWLLVLGVTSYVIKRYDLFNRSFKSKPGARRALRTLIYVATLLVTLGISAAVLYYAIIPAVSVMTSEPWPYWEPTMYGLAGVTATPSPTIPPTMVRTTPTRPIARPLTPLFPH